MTATRLASRAIVRLSPREQSEDVASFLQGLVTNDVSGELPVYAALLSAQGKTMFDFLVWRAPSTSSGQAGDLLIDCEASVAADLARRLSLYRLRRAIDIEVDERLSVHWSLEPREGAVPDPRLPELGLRWIEPASDSESADKAWLSHRLSVGVPEGQAELGDILWLETNAVELGGVSFSKGCYVGQENTARMNWRQKVNRRLVVVPASRSVSKRNKAIYPDLGLAVDHLRVEDLDLSALPEWQRSAISPAD